MLQQASVIELVGPLPGRRIELYGSMIIGREPSCPLHIPDASISRHHARLISRDEIHTLEDLGSTNGTLVNDAPLKPGRPIELQNMDLVTIGRVELKFFLYDPSQSRRMVAAGRTPTDMMRMMGATKSHKVPGRSQLVGASPQLLQIRDELVPRYAATDVPVLITGETGTGKELIAQAVHQESRRGERELITINCANLPAAQIEAELFGAKKGSYTGATADREGLFHAADGSTLFLDEIGDLPLAQQSRLLRVLQEGEIRPIGATTTEKVDVRIIAATHRNLPAMVEQGAFREDLLFRLAVLRIDVPALRERPDDIPLLAQHLLRRAKRKMDTRVPARRFSPEAREALQAYHWPGNVRELGNFIERLVIFSASETISREDLQLPTIVEKPLAAPPPSSMPVHGQTTVARLPTKQELVGGLFDSYFSHRGADSILPLAEIERMYILRAVAAAETKSQAAKALGISRDKLYTRLKTYE